MLKQNFRCPICAKHIFRIENDLEVCPVCGYENRMGHNITDDAPIQAEFPVRSFRAEYFNRRKEDDE
jgi:phage FluMu protein Com